MPLKTALHPPPGSTRLTRPTSSNPRPSTNPPLLNDALTIRAKVFLEEQHCSPEAEIDDDDKRSWHWVLYAIPENIGDAERTGNDIGDRKAIGVIRLVPPPHAPHFPTDATDATEADPGIPESLPNNVYDILHEPYIKLTRVALLPEYRGKGISRLLVETAMDWARRYPREIEGAFDRVVGDVHGNVNVNVGGGAGVGKWKGLVLVHAQVPVERMYGRLGFETDESMGRWDEEGIEHVGMWRRIQLTG